MAGQFLRLFGRSAFTLFTEPYIIEFYKVNRKYAHCDKQDCLTGADPADCCISKGNDGGKAAP